MKRIILIMALAASSAFAEHIFPDNPDPAHVAFFGQLGRDSIVVTNVADVSGAARPLPPFLHALSFDDVYPEAAAAWYRQADYSGNCSARRFGNVFERNMDWRFDYMPEFVVFVSAAPGRFASVGVSNVGTNLTEDMVTSGKWSPWLKALPGHTLDGVNENGVVACVNVVGGDPQTSGWHTDGDIHPLGAVRYALDNGTTAAAVAADLASHIRFPVGFAQNFHYMIADATSTYIVENGAAYAVTNAPAVMTNFRLYGEPADVNGAGRERYAMLTNAAVSITNAWFTNAYRGDGWASEFESDAERTAAITEWAKRPKEAHRGESFGGKSWWQSVHTSAYDITNKVLRICAQERGDWYTFALDVPGPSAAKVREIAAAAVESFRAGPYEADKVETARAIDERRQKTDMCVYVLTPTGRTCTVEHDVDGLLESFRNSTPRFANNIWALIGWENDTWSFVPNREQGPDANPLRFKFVNDWDESEQYGEITFSYGITTNGATLATSGDLIPFAKNGTRFVLDRNVVVLKNGTGYVAFASMLDLEGRRALDDLNIYNSAGEVTPDRIARVSQLPPAPDFTRNNPVLVATATDIVREHSGDYWDEELQVWWTGRMSGGKLTYMATTNVNLNAEH